MWKLIEVAFILNVLIFFFFLLTHTSYGMYCTCRNDEEKINQKSSFYARSVAKAMFDSEDEGKMMRNC
jgi:hypothetical protein